VSTAKNDNHKDGIERKLIKQENGKNKPLLMLSPIKYDGNVISS